MYDLVKRLTFPILKVEEVEPHPLPGHAEGEFRVIRPAPSYLRYRMFYWKLYAAAWGLGVLAVSIALLLVDWRFVFPVAALVLFAAWKAALLYVATRLSYEMRWYVLTDRSLLIRQGVWVVREIALTFANAQNVRVTQGPLQRVFGFSNVEVDTAGGGSKKTEEGGAQPHRAVLYGLEDPHHVRDLILEQLRRHRAAGLGDPDDREPSAEPTETGVNHVLLEETWTEARMLRLAMEKAAANSATPLPEA